MFDLFLGNALAEGVDAATQAGATLEGVSAAGNIASLAVTFLPLVAMVVIFYFLLIRPQRKKDKQVKDMLAALKTGDRVTTIGGIYGTIVSIRDDMITLAVGASKTEMVFARWAIRGVEEVSIENDSEVLA